MVRARAFVLAITATAAALLTTACSEQNQYVAPPPQKVTVTAPVQHQVTRYLELTGNTAAVNSTDLVARVSGFLTEVKYQDGAIVKKGAPLFTIEPEPYQVKLQQAQAAEAGAQATLRQAQNDYDRQAQLVAQQAVSKATLDTSTANRDAAKASYEQAQANTQLAKLNNDYAHVTAPFDGVVTARQVSVGQYVGGSGTPTVLASIVQIEPIYVNFNISEQDVLRIRAELMRQGRTREDLMKVPVQIGLQTETGYPHAGNFDYAAPTLNASTGTLAARAVFKNADGTLLPGYFVRVRIPVEQQPNALLVPDSALGSDQSGRYVLVVGSDNVVTQRNVKIGPLVNDLRVIEDGLKPDDKIVVAGLLRVIPGQKVDPQAQATTASAAAK